MNFEYCEALRIKIFCTMKIQRKKYVKKNKHEINRPKQIQTILFVDKFIIYVTVPAEKDKNISAILPPSGQIPSTAGPLCLRKN